MVVDDLSAQPTLGRSASIAVDMPSHVDDTIYDPRIEPEQKFPTDAFARAVDLTLTQAGLFGEIVSDAQGPEYQLKSEFVHIGIKFGASYFHKTSVVVVIDWKLFKANEATPLWAKQIVSTHRIKQKALNPMFSEGIELACKDNIRKAVLEMSKLASR